MAMAAPSWLTRLVRPLFLAWLVFIAVLAGVGIWLAQAPPLDKAVEVYQPLPPRPESETPAIMAREPAEAPNAAATEADDPDDATAKPAGQSRAVSGTDEESVTTLAPAQQSAGGDGGQDAAVATPEPENQVPEPPQPGGSANTPGKPDDDPFKRSDVMVPAPHPPLVEETKFGLLPVIAPNGRQSWQVYAAPFDDSDTRPQIAVVIQDLGLKSAITNQAVRLPPEVTLSFGPYSDRLEEWIDRARAAGHEVLLEVPMEPRSFPTDDPGPGALLVSQTEDENLTRLQRFLGNFVGYVGVTNRMGGAFAEERDKLRPILRELRRRGLLFLDRAPIPVGSPGLVADTGLIYLRRDVDLDTVLARTAIQQRFAEAEQIARSQGYAIAVAKATPVLLEMIENWLSTLGTKGLVAAPLTAVIAKRGV